LWGCLVGGGGRTLEGVVLPKFNEGEEGSEQKAENDIK